MKIWLLVIHFTDCVINDTYFAYRTSEEAIRAQNRFKNNVCDPQIKEIQYFDS